MNSEDLQEVVEVNALASEHGLRLEMIDGEVWQFRLSFPAVDPRWAMNLWPCVTGERNRERIQHDLTMPEHGPRLLLPRYWTLREGVEAAIAVLQGKAADGRAPVGGRMRRRW